MAQESTRRTIPGVEIYSTSMIPQDWQDPNIEPSIDEMLADPIVQLVMRRDHLVIGDVEVFLKSASRRLTRYRSSSMESVAHVA